MTALDLSRYHLSGPWIVVVEREDDSQLLLREIDAQCKAHGVYIDVVELAQVDGRTLFRYKAMIAILSPAVAPAQTDPETVDRVLALVSRFRKPYPTGVAALAGLGPGHLHWHEVGPVQILADASAFRNPAMRTAIDAGKVCAHHVLRAGAATGDIDLFAIYRPDEATLGHTSSQIAMQLQKGLELLRDWGLVVTPSNIAAVRARIDHWIAIYNGPRYTKVPGTTDNVLEYLLDDPDTKSPTPELAAELEDENFAKNWEETTQRAARRVLNDLLDTLHIERPWRDGVVRMHGKKGARSALEQLVTTVDEVMDLSDPEWGADTALIDSLSRPSAEPARAAVHE